jgi:hypothetical protein
VGARAKLCLDFGPLTSLGPSALDDLPGMALSAFDDAPVQDHLDGGVGREALSKVRVEISVLASNDEEGTPHLLLDMDTGTADDSMSHF